MDSRRNPQTMLMMIAICNGNKRIGTIKERAKINFEKNVAIVDSHISRVECTLSDSSDIWMPNESDMESAMAMISIPPITAISDPVLEFNPTINPSVVIIPEVRPKLNPFLIDNFI